MRRRRLCAVLALAWLGVAATPARALDVTRPEVKTFAEEVVARDHLDARWVLKLLAAAETKQVIIDAVTRPAEKVRPWFEYERVFLTEKRIREGREFYAEHRAPLEKAAETSGVPAPIIAAILGVESSYGRIVGPFREIDALATLAFDYPERGAFFRAELEQFLLLAHEKHLDPLTAMGSYAGAMGAPQFMPRAVRQYAVDGDGDGRIDLYGDWADIAASVANFLVHHGWKPGELLYSRASLADPDLEGLENGLALNTTVGQLAADGVSIDVHLAPDTPAFFIALRDPDAPTYRVGFHNFWVLTRYNRSAMYSLVVCELADAIAAPGEPAHTASSAR